MADELIRAGIPIDIMLYPNKRITLTTKQSCTYFGSLSITLCDTFNMGQDRAETIEGKRPNDKRSRDALRSLIIRERSPLTVMINEVFALAPTVSTSYLGLLVFHLHHRMRFASLVRHFATGFG